MVKVRLFGKLHTLLSANSVKKHINLCLFAFLALVISACSSSDDENIIDVQKVTVTDPIYFEIEGVEGKLYTNVDAFLQAMPPISAKRARVYAREIRDNAIQALRAYGYYHPKVSVILPDGSVRSNFKRTDSADTLKKTNATSQKRKYQQSLEQDQNKKLITNPDTKKASDAEADLLADTNARDSTKLQKSTTNNSANEDKKNFAHNSAQDSTFVKSANDKKEKGTGKEDKRPRLGIGHGELLSKITHDKSRLVRVVIEPGKPLFIRQFDVQILGEGAQYKTFARAILNSGLKPYTILDHGAYESLKSKIQEDALSLGFFDAKLETSRILVFLDQNVADITLIFDTGSRYKFGKIVANEKTQELLKPVDTLMILNEGKNFSTKTIQEYQTSLSQTNFYRSVDITPLVDEAKKSPDREVSIKVNLERMSNNLMRVGAGYSTDEGARLLFEWDKPLLNEYGHSFASYAKLSQVTQDASVIYKIPRRDPNLDYYYINASQTHTDLNDTLSDRSHLSLHYVANKTGKWRRDYSLRAEYEDFSQASESGYGWNLMPALLLSRRETSGGFDPTSGYSLSLDLTGASEAVSDYTFGRVLFEAAGVYSPTPNTRLIGRFEQGALIGPDALTVPPSLRFFAGGDNSIRGYGFQDKAPLQAGGLKGGRYLTTGSLEYQFPMGISSSRLALFVDAGLATDDYSEDVLFGPGIGYRFLSPYGTLRVDLAYGCDDTSVRLHFAFGPEF